MQNSQAPFDGEALSALRRFARAKPAGEQCELCGCGLSEEHPHLFERDRRKIMCACEACSILFCGQEKARFLRVPRRVKRLEKFRFTDEQWDAMMLPIGLAFFVRGKEGATQVLYPSPAGAMESLIALPEWNRLFADERALLSVEIEVEALVVNRIGKDAAYFILPIDMCYRLVGLIRMRWRGLSGGGDVWKAIAEFFEEVDRRVGKVKEVSHA
jgi:hypothetical protein